MNIRPIRTKADHKAALREISALMEADPKRGTVEFDTLDVLVTLVDAYEEKRHPVASTKCSTTSAISPCR